MQLMAVDPGKKAGWALWSDDQRDGLLVRSETIDGDDAHQVYDLLSALKPALVVIEEQHSGTIRKGRGPDGAPKAIRMPWASLRTLIRRADIWSVCAELLGMGLDVVLNVERGNASAIHVYQKLGFRVYCPFVEGIAVRNG